MAKEPNEYEWIKANRKYLNIKAIAEEVGMSYRILTGYAGSQKDGHGTPYSINEKHKQNIISIVKKIRTAAISTTIPKKEKKK